MTNEWRDRMGYTRPQLEHLLEDACQRRRRMLELVKLDKVDKPDEQLVYLRNVLLEIEAVLGLIEHHDNERANVRQKLELELEDARAEHANHRAQLETLELMDPDGMDKLAGTIVEWQKTTHTISRLEYELAALEVGLDPLEQLEHPTDPAGIRYNTAGNAGR